MTSILLTLALLQTPDPTLPVYLHDRVIIITRSEAESWYKSLSREKDWATVAALELALGVRSHHCDHTPTDAEVECFDK